jgi:DNA-directed RNA polymerase specialized sigma24 family protein
MNEDLRRLLLASGVHAHDGASAAPIAAMPSVSAGETDFDSVYALYRPLLRKIAMRKFRIPRGDVDTLVHDVFTTYLAQQDRVRELHPYLIGGICNAARDYWRKADREKAVFCDSETCPATPDDALINDVVKTLLVRSALGTLGQSCQEALYRFYVHGETATCIAYSRSTTQGSILRLLHYCRGRARAAYRALIEDRRIGSS